MPAGASAGLSGAAAEFRSEDASVLLRANGYSRFKSQGASTPVSIANDNVNVVLDLSGLGHSVIVDTDGYDALSSDHINFPFTGQYLVVVNIAFASNNTGRRKLTLEKAPSPFSSWSNVGEFVANAVNGEGLRCPVVEVIDADAGDHLRLKPYQSSGGGLNVNGCRIAVVFLGPA